VIEIFGERVSTRVCGQQSALQTTSQKRVAKIERGCRESRSIEIVLSMIFYSGLVE
jgi:hypothetical protein